MRHRIAHLVRTLADRLDPPTRTSFTFNHPTMISTSGATWQFTGGTHGEKQS